MGKSTKKWTVIFLVYGDFWGARKSVRDMPFRADDEEISKELKLLYERIIEAGTSKEVDTFIIYNRVYAKINSVTDSFEVEKDTTYLLKVVPDDSCIKRSRVKLIERLLTPNLIQKKEELGLVFRKIKELSTSNRSILFTWDHGRAFGIFYSLLQRNTSKKQDGYQVVSRSESLERLKVGRIGIPKKEAVFQNVVLVNRQINDQLIFDVVKSRRYTDGSTRTIGIANPFFLNNFNQVAEVVDSETNEVLTNDELAAIIKFSFGDKKLDVLVMMNCIMQNVHTGYSFRNTVKYLVAPQTDISVNAYNYFEILRSIHLKPEIGSKELAKKTISTLFIFPQSTFLFREDLRTRALFAISLKKYQNVIDLINGFCVTMINRKNGRIPSNTFLAARNLCNKFDDKRGTHQIDLLNWVNSLKNLTDDKEVDDFLYELYKLKSKLVIESEVGTRIFPLEFINNLPPSSFNIFFPRTSDEFNASIDIFGRTSSGFGSSFLEESSWRAFLKSFF